MRNLLIAVPCLLASTGAAAQGVEACDKVLIKDTLVTNSSASSDWRLAKFVNESAYSEAKTDASGNAVISGVPVGGAFKQYQENIQEMSSGYSESFSMAEARSLMWIGLSAASASAYAACLEANSSGEALIVAPGVATTTHTVLKLKWKRGDYGPPSVNLNWQATPSGNVSALPKKLNASVNWRIVQIKRPTIGSTLLTINASDKGNNVGSAAITVAHYSPPPIPKPFIAKERLKWTAVSEIVENMPLDAVGREISFSIYANSKANSENGGTIELKVHYLDLTGWHQWWGAEPIGGSGNIDIRRQTPSFKVRPEMKKIRIQSFDTDANADFIIATVYF
jgi:hypothetical protein